MTYRCEDEIHAIRIKLYEETKHMSKDEQDKRLRETGERIAKEFGFEIIPSAK